MQLKYHMVTIEDLVPGEHFLRELEAALDLSFVYEERAHVYSRRYGRPPIDPVVIVKYLLVGYLYSIPSERQIEQRCADSNAFRWYLGIDLDERGTSTGSQHDQPAAAAEAHGSESVSPLAHRVLEEQGITFFVRPQAAHDRTNVELKRDAFSYDIEQDAYICPTGKQLRLNTLHRSASGLYWLYQADKRDCQSCPLREKCLSENDRRGARKLEHSYFASERQRHLAHRHDADYKDALKKRQIWCEGTFAAQKWGHNLTRVLRRGLGAAEDHCLLSATALNLKRMIKCMG